MTQKNKEDKQARRDAKLAWEQARVLLAAGNYKAARQLDLKVATMVPATELGRQAEKEAEELRTDPYALWAGIGFTLLYLLSWTLALL